MPKSKKIEIVKKGKVVDITIKKKKTHKLPPIGPRKIKGHGDYSIGDFAKTVVKPFVDDTPSKGLVNKAARFAGSKLGDLTGIPGAGEALGNAGAWLARVIGFGDYTVRRNSFMNSNPNNNPMCCNSGVAQFSTSGGFSFSHREYVMDITSSINFSNQGYLINAGNPLLFPWLFRLASNYEEYEFLGLVFEFKSTSATAVGSTNTGLGTLIMATDYDCIDSNYSNKQAMEIADFATSSAPCHDQIHPVECDPRRNVMRKFFVQNATTLAGYPDDPRFSVLGNFQIATSGVQSPSVVGELWVSYHVRLSKPQIASLSTLQSQPFVHSQWSCLNATTITPINTSSYPSNNGLTITQNISYADVTCSNSLGTGSYLIVLKSVDVGSGTLSTYPTQIALLSGAASFAGTSLTPVSDSTYATGYGNASCSVLTNHIGLPTAVARQGTLTMAIVNFTAVNASVRIFGSGDSANTMIFDLYVTPYASANLSKPLSEKAQMKAKLDEVYRLVEQMKSPIPPEVTVSVRDSTSSDVEKVDSTCNNRTRLVERRPACITISQVSEPETPPGSEPFRYVDVVRSEPNSRDTNQLRRN